ncbi:MAG: acylneuraminate cytidylyltransferase family protein [Phycisphaerae bacterium]|jgi:CMP-N-acetylneuraminic acid synthetase
MKSKILAVIPARGGSKAVPYKNIKLLLGRPLVEYTFEAAKASKLLNRIIISTDDEKIAEIAGDNKIEVPFFRPKELAQDDTPSLPVIKHAVSFLEEKENYKPDYIVILQPTSPLRKALHIDEALKILIETGTDSVVSVMHIHHQCNPYSVMEIRDGKLVPFIANSEKYTQRQAKPAFYVRNGAAIYAFKYETLMKKNSFFGDDCRPYLMNKVDSVDIDDLIDFEFAELLLSKRQKASE